MNQIGLIATLEQLVTDVEAGNIVGVGVDLQNVFADLFGSPVVPSPRTKSPPCPCPDDCKAAITAPLKAFVAAHKGKAAVAGGTFLQNLLALLAQILPLMLPFLSPAPA